MHSKNWTYCQAFPNSIALRRDIAKANQSRLPLCVHALTAGGEGGGKGSEQGIRRTESERQGKGGRQRKQNRHGEKSGGRRREGARDEV